MPFQSILRQLLKKVPGVQGAVIVDWEGETVELIGQNAGDEQDLKLLGAHGGIFYNRVREVCAQIGDRAPGEIVVRTTSGSVMVFPLVEDYLLVVQLSLAALVPAVSSGADVYVKQLRGEMAL